MTQYKNRVEEQRKKLKQEQLDNQVTCIDCRYKDGKWTEIMTIYASGKRVTEYNDKRKKDKIEWQ